MPMLLVYATRAMRQGGNIRPCACTEYGTCRDDLKCMRVAAYGGTGQWRVPPVSPLTETLT